jgi:beta-lactamase regulating signal transducer with metallopeptidase domain
LTMSPSTHWLAAVIFERMLYCLAEGTALAAVMALVLRLVPQRNSRTRFAVWFATLAALVVLPLVQMGIEIGKGSGGAVGLGPSSSAHAILTLSSAWVEYIILGWVLLAGLGLVRVAASLQQIRRLRRGCVAIDPRVLGPELQAMVERFKRRRSVAILVSSRLEVPTAMGFLRPVVLVPEWLAHQSQSEELKYVLLHELAHLQRWDDWTNLAQKLVKAVLFFHPGVWWIERKLSLDREMACDDAVLSQSSSPRAYAQCLARVAERSFLRRQIALAQAAVDRMRQLSLRVARILDGNRPRSTRLWKPAIPMVAVVALLCAISTSNTPDLVSLRDDQPAVASRSASAQDLSGASIDPFVSGGPQAIAGKSVAPFVNMVKFDAASTATQPRPLKARAANLKSQSRRSSFVPARYVLATHLVAEDIVAEDKGTERASNIQSPSHSDRATLRATNFSANDDNDDNHKEAGEAPTQHFGLVLLVVTSERINSAGSVSWQVNMWEVRLPVPASHPTKPVPRKT